MLSAFAFDYDGTLAHEGRVAPKTIAALERLRRADHKLVLVTGRQLGDLEEVFPKTSLFDAAVAENGGVLHLPRRGVNETLGAAPPRAFVEALERRGVTPLSVGRSIVATSEPHELAVIQTLRQLGLDWQISHNKGAVMCLPRGIDKESGLRAALARFGLSLRQTVGIGDAENDRPFLKACGLSVAVANAVESLQLEANLVTRRPNGEGVIEAIGWFLD